MKRTIKYAFVAGSIILYSCNSKNEPAKDESAESNTENAAAATQSLGHERQRQHHSALPLEARRRIRRPGQGPAALETPPGAQPWLGFRGVTPPLQPHP